jgi:hypothetical protein
VSAVVSAVGGHVVGAQHVGLGAVRDGDDGVGFEDGGTLHPGAHGVAGAELLGLPGAQRFERVRGEHEWGAVEFFGEEAGHGDIPGMGVADVDALERLDLGEVEAEGFERALELAGGAMGDLVPGLLAAHVEAAQVRVLLAPAVDLDVDRLRELATEVVDVNAGAAVDVRRVFLGEERCSHSGVSWRPIQLRAGSG